MDLRNLKFVIISLMTFITAPVVAQNVQIESDTARYYHDKGQMVHSGNVVVHWQNKTLYADELTIYKDDKAIDKLVAIGKPATFDGQVNENSGMVTGQADVIEYYMQSETIVLKDQAQLDYQGDTFHGPQISFNLKDNSIVAQRDESSRPTLTFGSNIIER